MAKSATDDKLAAALQQCARLKQDIVSLTDSMQQDQQAHKVEQEQMVSLWLLQVYSACLCQVVKSTLTVSRNDASSESSLPCRLKT